MRVKGLVTKTSIVAESCSTGQLCPVMCIIICNKMCRINCMNVSTVVQDKKKKQGAILDSNSTKHVLCQKAWSATSLKLRLYGKFHNYRHGHRARCAHSCKF